MDHPINVSGSITKLQFSIEQLFETNNVLIYHENNSGKKVWFSFKRTELSLSVINLR